MKPSLPLLSLFLVLSSCTWVDVNEQGYRVSVISASQAQSCEKKGSVSAQVLDRIGPIFRSEAKIQEELISLARNDAGAMGGNAILPIESPWNGEQNFDVYSCN